MLDLVSAQENYVFDVSLVETDLNTYYNFNTKKEHQEKLTEKERSSIEGEYNYSQENLEILSDYFCDWPPYREKDLDNPAHLAENLTRTEKENLYINILQSIVNYINKNRDNIDQTVSLTGNSIESIIDELKKDNKEKYNFILRYIWRFSKELASFNPEKVENTYQEESKPSKNTYT